MSQHGEKPSQIISAQLTVGYQIRPDASNGNTDVLINNRQITKSELWMLQVSGAYSLFQCNVHLLLQNLIELLNLCRLRESTVKETLTFGLRLTDRINLKA